MSAAGSQIAAGRVDLARVQGRTVPVLAGMQVLAGLGIASGVAVNGLLAQEISGSASMAGLAQTMSVVGAALLALPLARLATLRGRRPALSTGLAIASVGGAVSILAGVTDQFAVLLLGAALFGSGTATGLQARYAALDAAGPQGRGRSLSLVVWASTVGSVVGPNLSEVGGRAGVGLGVPALTGPFLFSTAAFVLAALVCWALLRPDPLLAARDADAAAVTAGEAVAVVPQGAAAAVRAAVRSRAALLGLIAIGAAHGVMVSVMVMTPVHLHEGGATLRVVGLVISVHIAGMFAASPVMGWLTDRVGRRETILIGVAVLTAALLVAATSGAADHARLGVALALLGLGWSACLVAGSTLVSESVPAEVRTAVQGVSDLGMGVVAAVGGALAGPVLAAWGYPVLAAGAGLLLLPVLALALVPGLRVPGLRDA